MLHLVFHSDSFFCLLCDAHFNSFPFGPVTNAAAVNILRAYMSFDEHVCPVLLGIHLGKNCGATGYAYVQL